MKAISVFKKAAIPALVLLLILAMTVSLIPMVSAADDTDPTTGAGLNNDPNTPQIASNTLAISGDITLVTYFTPNGLDGADYVTVSFPKQNGGTNTIKTTVEELNASKDDNNGRWAVKAPLAAAQLTDTVTITWYKANGEKLGYYKRNAKAFYIDKVIAAAAPGNAYEPLVAPLKSLLNYGAMAQAQFKHNTDSLANEGLYADANPVDGMTTDHLYDAQKGEKNDTESIKFLGATAYFQSSVRLSVYFNAPEGATVKISDGNRTESARVYKDETGYFVNINNIASFNFNKVFTIKVTSGSETATAKYSVLGYAQQLVDSYKVTDNTQKDTAKALYQFYEQSKHYYTTDGDPKGERKDYTVGPKDENGTLLTCEHTRTHTEGTYIVCSDCGVNQREATRVGFKAEVVELTVGEAKDITFTLNVAGKVDLSAIVVNLVTSENLTLIYKEGSAEFGNGNLGGEIGLNIEVDAANAITENCTLVTLTYTATATEAGTYTITPVICEAINGANNNIANDIVVSAATLTAKDGWCGNITGYDITATSHRAYCDECRNVYTAENHNFVAEKVVADGKLSINTAVCDVCDAAGANNVHNVYTLGFELDADDNKTEKAPLFFLTPSEIADNAANGTRLGAIEMAEDGSYVTIHNKTDATKEGYFSIISSNQNETGRYLAIKYRTKSTSNMEFFAGANNGQAGAVGGENFYLTTGAILVKDGEWHVAILDLGMLRSSQFKPDDDGKYRADYIRWDIFNDPKSTDETVDIAYVAMSNDIMSVASFDGNDYYRVGTSLNKESAVVPSYMGSTVTLNPVADAAWINGAVHAGGQTHVVESDSANGGLKYSHITRKGSTGDNYVTLVSVPSAATYSHWAHTTDNAHVLAIIYRTNTSATHHEGWVNSTAAGGQGSQDKFLGHSIISAAGADYNWRVAVVNLDSAFQNADGSKTNYYDPAIGMSTLRFDYWNLDDEAANNIAEGELIGDFAFFGVFESTDAAYAYCGEYLSNYGVECMHYATTGWQFISNEGTEFEGTRYAVEAKLCALCGEAVETRSAVVAVNFDSIHVDTADGTDSMATWGTSAALKAGDMSLRVMNLYTATSASKSGNQGTKYPAPSFLRDNKVINGGGWAGINGLFSGTAYYRVLDKSGNVLLDWTAKGNSRVATNAGTAVQNAVNNQIGNNTLHVVSDARRFTMNEIDLSAYASYYQAESSRYENAPITLEYAFQAEGAPEGSDLVMVVKINNIYKNCTSHKMHNVTVEENGKLAVYTECANCGKLESSYTMNIGSKAPNYFIGAADLADRVAADSQVMSKTYTLSDDGSYVTLSNTAGKGDGYVNIFLKNSTVTGRYVVIKYRTTAGGGWQFYTGSNSSNPKPAGTAGDTFYLTGATHDTTDQNRVKGGIISDGNWHYTIVDLAMLSAFKPYDDGSYMAQYFRWDIFDSKFDDTKTTDVAYIAFADDIETLKAMDDMVTFQYAFKQYSGKSEAAVLPMSTTVGENNPFFDANHLAAKGLGLNSSTVLKTDAANGNMPYAQFTSTKTTEQYFDVWNNQNYKIAGSGKYIGVLYRSPSNSSTSFEFFVSSNSSGAVGGCNKSEGITRDNQWRFMYIDISTLKTADGKTYYKDSEGLGQLRFDVLNGGMSATATIDIGFLGFFDDVEDMAATLTAYNELYGLNIPTTPLGITSNTTSIDANGTFDVTITEKVQNSFTSGTFNVSGIPSDATIADATFGAGVTATIDGNNIVVTAIDRTLFDGTIANITFKTTYKTAGGDYTLSAAGTLKNGELTVSAWTGAVVNNHVVNVVAHVCSGDFTITSTQHTLTCTICGTTETGDHTYGNSTVTETAGVVNYVNNCTVCGYKFSELISASDRTPNAVITAAEIYNSFGDINKSHVQFFNYELKQDADGTGFIRLSGGKEATGTNPYLYVYRPENVVETGRYLVYRYRLPANGRKQTSVQFYVSTTNGGMAAYDNSQAPAVERTDGEWYTVIIDLAEFGKTFTADENGKYSAKYVRIDPFYTVESTAVSANDYFDLQFVALCDELTDYLSPSSQNTILYNKTAGTSHSYNQFNGYMSWDGSEKLGGKTTITEANGLTYNKYLSNSSSEQNLGIYSNATALTPVSDYLAIIYRAPKTVMSGGTRITNKVGYAEVFIHSTATSAQGNSYKTGSSYTKDGTWKVMVIDLTSIGATYDPATGMTSLRLDYFNGDANTLVKNGELHIAAISFVKNAAAGTAWYNEFLNEFYPEGQTEYVTPDVCTTENHYNRDGWVSAGVAEDGTLLEKTFCTCCNTTMEQRNVYFRGWMNGYYINDTKVNSGNLYQNSAAIDLAGKGVATTFKINGWFATESGVHTYYYRVNGGEWIAFTNTKLYSESNTGIGNDVNGQNKGIDNYWTNSQFNGDNGHITTGDLTIDYAGQTVTLELGFAPNNNPTTIQLVKTFTNLQVASDEIIPTYVYLNNIGGTIRGVTYRDAFEDNTALNTSTSAAYLGRIYISGRVAIEGSAQKLVYRLLDANGNEIQGWQELDFYSSNNYTVNDVTGTSHLSTAQKEVPEVTNVYEYVGLANLTAFPGQTVTVECALVLDGVEGEAANYTFMTFTNVTNTESAS